MAEKDFMTIVVLMCYYHREEQEQKEAYPQLRKTIELHF